MKELFVLFGLTLFLSRLQVKSGVQRLFLDQFNGKILNGIRV